MKKTSFNKAYRLLKIAFYLLTVIAIINFKNLPDLILIHWNGSGAVNNSVEKGHFLLSIWIIYSATLLIDKIEYKRADYKDNKTSNIIIIVVLTLFLLIFAYLLLTNI
ncbi:hypothetical protein JNO63_05895 [Anaerococcus sp. mt242]|uniref:hypothetical protein n=1 Tax=Anaerococcus sp. mt242 TaxID=2661917 RepID=UPI00193496F1|nr:hypothetical protein [Anaerococcus sp. mt242]MBM0046622.1 hypothetical protein [Anaerococcus sp. mt242]